jgi:hypothetical protein
MEVRVVRVFGLTRAGHCLALGITGLAAAILQWLFLAEPP